MTETREYRVIGKRVPKPGPVEFVVGQAAFGADIYLPGMLYGKILRSPHAHARIRGIDASRALALEGVKAVVTGEDIPEAAPGATFPMGDMDVALEGVSRLVMAQEKALFHGHAVAAVAAVDPWTAEEALELIRVEYEELPPVLDVEEAMKEGAPLIDPSLYTEDDLGARISERPSNIAKRFEVSWGDVEKGFAEADVIIEETYSASIAHQGYIEPQACVARVEPDGKITVWCTSQGAFAIQMQLHHLLHIPLNRIKVVPTEVGGAFGGKIFTFIEPLAVLLAQKSGQPVKMVLTREEVLRSTGPGAAARFRVKTGCRQDGTITAVDFWTAYDAGCSPGAPADWGIETSMAPYGKVPHLRSVGYDVLTNKPKVHPYRAPGAPQAAFAMEQNVDAMAKALGMDPVEFRLKNASEEGDPRTTGEPFNRIGVKELLQRVKESDHYRSPLAGPNRGRGFAIGYWFGAIFTSSAHITINPDGTASLVVGSVDITGTRSALQQIAAEELGMELADVTISVADTETVGYTDVTGGSRTTYMTGSAVYRACQDAIEQLKARAARKFQVSLASIEFAGGRFWVKEEPRKVALIRDLAFGPEGTVVGRGTIGRQALAAGFSAGVVDVEVDPETGKTRVLRYTAFQDVGKAINPTRIEAQMQAGTTQGIGWALTEEYVYDQKGVLLNASLLDYRQPVAPDLPFIDTEFVEVPASEGPYGVRGVGEPPIVHPPATIANAIHSATGLKVGHMPMTPERVFMALKRKG